MNHPTHLTASRTTNTADIDAFARSHSLPPGVLAAWRERGLGGWTALQAEAWRRGLLQPPVPGAAPVHWLISAPTSAGKGFLAEVLATLRLLRGEKVLWLTPTRALAEAVHTQFAQTLHGTGLRLSCATGEKPLPAGGADLLVAVYEKAQAWLVRQPHPLAELGLIVADELSLLRDPERGGRLDHFLTMLMSAPYEPQRVGLLPPVSNLNEVADWWLGGRPGQVLTASERPRPLREGVLTAATGLFCWRDRATGEEGAERLISEDEWERWLDASEEGLGAAPWPPLASAHAALAAGLARRAEPTILFATSRPQARQWAAGLARAFGLPPAAPATLEEARQLARCEPCHDHHLLAAALAGGVALHHADLGGPARRLAERAFNAGECALLIATPTVAQGMNFAVRNTVHWPQRLQPGPAAGAWQSLPLERWQWLDQGGRAARFGRGTGAGRSLLLAWDEAQAERLWAQYLDEPVEALRSRPCREDLELGILTALAGDVARTPDNLRALAGQTLAARMMPSTLDASPEAAGWAQAWTACQEAQLMQSRDPANPAARWRLSGLGQICAAHGLDTRTLGRLRPWLAEAAIHEALAPLDPPDAALPALWALTLSAPPGLWPLTARSLASEAPVLAATREWFAQRGAAPPVPLTALFARNGAPEPFDPSTLAALEAGWRLACWIGPEPTETVEERTGWTAGTLARTGEALAWLARAAAEAGAVLGHAAAGEGWRRLAIRLAAGVTGEGAALAGLLHVTLTRTGIQALCADGLTTIEALAEAPLSLLTGHLGDGELARQARAAARQARGRQWRLPGGRRRAAPAPWESFAGLANTATGQGAGETQKPAGTARTDGHTAADGAATAASPGAPARAIEIDLQSPGVIRVAGRDLNLRPLSFDLLAILAERPGKVVSRAALYQRLWPEGDVDEQQLDAHRRHLARQLRDAGLDPEQSIEVVRGMGFRLNLGAESVRLRRG